ncbi:MAG: IS3 family transposase [Oligoflexus sp.]|nr:IS3 family transposase [Oligoflexus sp.]
MQPILTDHALMNHLDTQYTATPFYGSRKMAKVISLQTGIEINRKRVQRLMQAMAITAIYPKPNTSRPNRQNRVYPYLLTGLTITRPNMVWATDITYIRVRHGFVYLVAVLELQIYNDLVAGKINQQEAVNEVNAWMKINTGSSPQQPDPQQPASQPKPLPPLNPDLAPSVQTGTTH